MVEPPAVDLRYGWFGWKPVCLQWVNRPKWFLLWLTLGNTFITMLVNGLIGVVMTSLEVRFQLNSNETGWISSAYEMAAVPIYVLIVIFGTSIHRPRWSAVGLLAMVVGSVLFFIPHYTSPVYRPDSNDLDSYLCLSPGGAENETLDRSCSAFEDGEGGSGSLSWYLIVFLIARVLQGLGATPLITCGVIYVDDTMSKEDFSFYISFFIAAGVVGPTIGYILGGVFLGLYTDFTLLSSDEISITTDDPRWVGAWWLGFLIASVTLFLIAIPISGYANDLPGAAEIREKKVTEAYNVERDDDDVIEGGVTTTDRLVTSCRELVRNPTYIFLVLYGATDAFIVTAFTTFGPKYVESQYGISAGVAGILFGVLVVPGGAIGTVLGGWAIKRFHMTILQIMKAELLLTVLLVCSGFMFFIICDPVPFAGVNTPYSNTSTVTNLSDPCNENCGCTNLPFSPVCGADNIRYYTPCHAGCSMADDFPAQEFYNCSCLPVSDQTAKRESCSSGSCDLIILFSILFLIAMFFLFTCMCMTTTVTFRCVPRHTRPAALGIQGIVARVLGTVPGPILFGFAFDASCSLWQETCGTRGTCLSYNNVTMSLYIFLSSMGVKIISIFFMLACWKLYKPPQLDTITKEVDTLEEDQHTLENGGVVSPVFEDEPIYSIPTKYEGQILEATQL